ncbi:MAG: PfkB family carbohydrate kinase [Pyrinomonadaceae bacterium]
MVVERKYDVLAIGRSSIDLYAREIGAPFTEIKSFAAYVGGCPTNISVCTQRLGLRTALQTALGEDLVGDFVLKFLEGEGVVTDFSRRKPGRRTSAFLLGIEPPDHFPLVPYRDNCADLELTIDDILAAPIAESRVLLITGTGLSRSPSRDATIFAAEQARAHNTKVVLDLDFRAELWPDARSYGVAMRSIAPLVNVVIGTHDEVVSAFALTSETNTSSEQSQTSHINRELWQGIEAMLAFGPEALVMKRGEKARSFFRAEAKLLRRCPLA